MLKFVKGGKANMEFNKRGQIQLNKEELAEYNNRFDNNTRKEFIGEMLRELRDYAGITQSELCDLIGIKSGTYSTYENGTREAPAEIVVRLAILYGVPCDMILQRERYSREKIVSSEQFNKVDEQIKELREEVYKQDKELNPEFKNVLLTMADAFSNVTEQLKEFNENAKTRNNK